MVRAIVLAGICLLPTAAWAGDNAIGIKAGALGLGVEYTRNLSDRWAIRGGINGSQLSFDGDESGINYQFDFVWDSLAVGVDLHPFKSPFRLSAGILRNNNGLNGDSRPTSNVTIQLLEKDSFPSGSANLETSSVNMLAKVGTLVGAMTGAITVSGHTDNVPVRPGGAYRSNWDLSAARAASVGHELLAAGLDPTRLMVTGHADTQPRAPNDSPANRALNRRVDITFANGRDRPSRWEDAAPAPR